MKISEFWIAIISHNRWEQVPKMKRLIESATWYIGDSDDELFLYKSFGAKSIVKGGGLCQARNKALVDAWERDLTCVQLSDDLTKINVAIDKKTKQTISVLGAISLIYDEMLTTDAYLGGGAPTDNAFYFNPSKPVSYNHFIVGDLSVVRQCELWWDEELKLKEDYDYTLQHLQKYKKVVRRNDVLASFKHRSNKGGAVDYRTENKTAEKVAIEYLKNKWGNKIKDNPRRENEILIDVRLIEKELITL